MTRVVMVNFYTAVVSSIQLALLKQQAAVTSDYAAGLEQEIFEYTITLFVWHKCTLLTALLIKTSCCKRAYAQGLAVSMEYIKIDGCLLTQLGDDWALCNADLGIAQ